MRGSGGLRRRGNSGAKAPELRRRAAAACVGGELGERRGEGNGVVGDLCVRPLVFIFGWNEFFSYRINYQLFYCVLLNTKTVNNNM
jgi:hypothetical protein